MLLRPCHWKEQAINERNTRYKDKEQENNPRTYVYDICFYFFLKTLNYQKEEHDYNNKMEKKGTRRKIGWKKENKPNTRIIGL